MMRSARFRGWMSGTLLCWILGVAGGWMGNQVVGQAVRETARRSLFVPADQLEHLLGGPNRRVLLKREEYERLLARVQAAMPEPVDQPPPASVTINGVEYVGTFEPGRAVIVGDWSLDVLAPGLHYFDLPLAGVGIEQARFDNRPASLGRADSGALRVFVEGVGSHRLRLEWIAPIESDAARQTLSATFPAAGGTRLRLNIPGNVELVSGGSVVTRQVDALAGLTRFELLPASGGSPLVFSLNNRQRQAQSRLVARSIELFDLAPEFERVELHASLSVLQGSVDRVRLLIPAGFEIDEVASPHMARWTVATVENRRVLEIGLRQAISERLHFDIYAARNSPIGASWRREPWTLLDVAAQSSVLALRADPRLSLEAFDEAGLIPLEWSVFDRLTSRPAGPQVGEPPRVQGVYYSPSGAGSVEARVSPRATGLQVQGKHLIEIQASNWAWSAELDVRPEGEKRFQLELHWPAGWQLRELLDAQGESLAYERLVTNDGSTIRLRFPEGLVPNAAHRLTFRAVWAPAGWLGKWARQTHPLPRALVAGATSERGTLIVRSTDDLGLRPLVTEKVVPSSANQSGLLATEGDVIAFEFDEGLHRVELEITRRPAQLTAQSLTFYRLEPDALHVHAEILFDIWQASVDAVEISLPAESTEGITLRAAETLVTESTSALRDGRRVWTARLRDRVTGSLRLIVDFSQPLELGTITLPEVRAEGVAYQSRLVALEGGAELAVELGASGAAIDVGELARAEYQPGRRLIGAWEQRETDAALAITTRRHPQWALTPAIVTEARLTTIVGTQGAALTQAEFKLQSKQSFLGLELPAGEGGRPSALWSVRLDDRPIKPQRLGDRLLIDLPPSSTEALRRLVVVYETPVQTVGVVGRCDLAGARLVQHDGEGDVVPLPVADANWSLYIPRDVRLWSTGSTLLLRAHSRGPGLLEVLSGLGSRHSSMSLAKRTLDWDEISPAGGQFYGPPGSVQFQPDVANIFHSEGGKLTFPMTAPAMPEDQAITAAPPIANPGPQQPAENKAAAVDGLANQAAEKRREEKGQDRGAPAAARLAGFRSLAIELESNGEFYQLSTLGALPRLELLLVQRARFERIAWTVALCVGLVLLAGLGWTWRRRILVLMGIVLATSIPPLLANRPEWVELLNPTFYVACWGLIGFLVRDGIVGVGRLLTWVWSGCLRRFAPSVAAFMLVLIGATAGGQEPADERPAKPLVIPDDALVYLYDQVPAEGLPKADRVLVPLAEYERLLRITSQPPQPDATPAPFAWNGGRYSTRLVDGTSLDLTGQLDLTIYAGGPIEVPLMLRGGVILTAQVDGQPARLKLVAPPPAQGKAPAGVPIVTIIVEGRGAHRLDWTLRFPLRREAGWSIVEGQLPHSGTSSLTATVPAVGTEVRLGGVPDREPRISERVDETFRYALIPGEPTRIAWRPRLSIVRRDPSLQATSEARVHVQEDGVRLAWNLALEFRGEPRETFRLRLPTGYAVDHVRGGNIRGFQIIELGENRELEVTLLRPAVDREQFDLGVSWSQPFGDAAQTVDVPAVEVVDAALHQGSLVISRSVNLELRTVQAAGAARINLPEKPRSEAFDPGDLSPLGSVSFEAYRFSAVPFQLRLSVTPPSSGITSRVRTLVRIGARERRVESLVLWRLGAASRQRLEVEVPADWRVQRVQAPWLAHWSLVEQPSGRVLEVRFDRPMRGDVEVTIEAEAGPRGTPVDVPVPAVVPRGVMGKTSELAVLADPVYTIEPRKLVDCTAVPIDRVTSWLSLDDRRFLRAAAVSSTVPFSGTWHVTRRSARLSLSTVTNARLERWSMRETMLLDYTIRDAGVRELSFLLPRRWQDARFQVPWLRELRWEELADEPDWLRVRLVLQDDVTGQLRLLVERDQARGSQRYEATIPRFDSGVSVERFVLLESAGEAELVVDAVEGLETLSRQQREFQALDSWLGISPTAAYRALPETRAPRLSFSAAQRERLRTVGARIPLAETRLIVDALGTYRASQTFRIDNKTEPYLEIELPAGATLWTARVAGEGVKPVVAPTSIEGGASRRVLIPLVKTADGDLDDAVVLKYGGKLGGWGVWSPLNLPFLKTINVAVEQSQVELYLPESHAWFDFQGTLRRIDEEAEMQASYLSYYNDVAERLARQVSSGDEFAKIRALNSYSQVQSSLTQLQSQVLEGNRGLANELNARQQEIEIKAFKDQATFGSGPNPPGDEQRKALIDNYRMQQAQPTSNLALRGSRVDAVQPQAKPQAAEPGGIAGWLTANGLERSQPQGETLGVKQAATPPALKLPAGAGKANAAPKPEQDAAKSLPKQDAESLKRMPNAPPPMSPEPRRELDVRQQYQQRLNEQTRESGERSLRDGRTLNETESRQSLGGIIGGGRRDLADAKEVSNIELAPTGLASLDVEFPPRGRLYRLTTPRGELQLTVRGVDQSWLDSWGRLALILALSAASIGVLRLIQRGVLSWLLTIIGLAMLTLILFLSGYWVLALIALTGSIAGLICRWESNPLISGRSTAKTV